MKSEVVATFEFECRDLGAACAAARLRLDRSGPDAYRQAHAAYVGTRRYQPYFVRKWLSVRLSAVKRGMVVDQTVTPAFLEHVTEARCPVTLRPFSTNERSPENPSVDRLVNEVTYRAGNICVLSVRANRAKGERSFEDVALLARAGEAHAGLEPVEWVRLASLMYGAWSHYRQADPYLLPLAALPSPGLLTSTSQVVQLLLTRDYADANVTDEATRRWGAMTRECGCKESVFLDLSEKLARALATEDYAGNAWLRADVFEAFVAWYKATSSAIAPIVEEVLSEHRARVGDTVVLPKWRALSRRER